MAEFISGVIMQHETIRQKSSDGTPSPRFFRSRASFPASRSTPARSRSPAPPGETVTEGLDGLRDRLLECDGEGARLAKSRADSTVRVLEGALPGSLVLGGKLDQGLKEDKLQ